MDVFPGERAVGVSPQLEIPPCKLPTDRGEKFKGWAQSSPDLALEMHIENGRGRAEQVEHFECDLHWRVSRNLHLPPLKATILFQSIPAAVVWRLPRGLRYHSVKQAGIPKGRALQEEVSCGEWEKETKLLGQIQRPVG